MKIWAATLVHSKSCLALVFSNFSNVFNILIGFGWACVPVWWLGVFFLCTESKHLFFDRAILIKQSGNSFYGLIVDLHFVSAHSLFCYYLINCARCAYIYMTIYYMTFCSLTLEPSDHVRPMVYLDHVWGCLYIAQ